MTQVSITVRDGIAYLALEDDELREVVVNACSYKAADADYRVRDNRRDRRTKLVRNNKCPVGLLDRVCQVVETAGHELVVTRADSWTRPKPTIELRVYEAVPRDYQQEAQLAAILYDRGIIRAPTGSGKSLMAALIIAAKRRHALVIVPTIDLLYQLKSYLAWHLALAPGQANPSNERWHIGQLGDGVVDPQPITVATIRTIAQVVDVAYEPYEYAEYDDSDPTEIEHKRALRDWVQEIGTVLVDEAHILGAKTVYGVTVKIPAPNKFGMSASPWRDDGADLMIEAATGPLIYHVTAERLVQAGHLLAPRIEVHDTSAWWTSAAWGRYCVRCGRVLVKWVEACACGGTVFRSQFPEAYREEIVRNEVRNTRIADIVQQLAVPTLVLVKQVRHGRNLQALIPGSVLLTGRDAGEYRERTFQQLRDGDLRTVICTTIADMGLDIPNLGALVLAGGGKSSVRHLQRIGRVVRPAPGKPQPRVIDFDDGHIHRWFSDHEKARRKIERAEWGDLATWARV